MRWASFRRAARFRGSRRRGWWTCGLAFVSAVCTVLLVADVGLILDLIHRSPGEGLAAGSWTFAAWLGWPDASWGWLDRYEYCLLSLLAILLILATVEALLLLLLRRTGELAAWNAVAQLQIAVYEQVRRLGVPDWFEREGRQVEQRILADCLTVREGLAAYWTTVPRSLFAVVLLVALAAYVDFFLSLLAILLLLFIWRLYQKIQVRADAAKRNAQSQLATRQQAVLDAFRTARIVEGVTAAECNNQAFTAAFDRYRRDTRYAVIAHVAQGPWLVWLLGMGAALLLLVVGLSSRDVPLGLAVLALALVRLSLPVLRLQDALQTLRRAEEAAGEVFDFLDRTPSVGQIAGALAIGRVTREVRWEGVAVAGHAGKPLLTNLSFDIPAGSLTAIVASDCHTPLTMVGLLLRHQDPTAGRILLDGTDLRSLTLRSLREQMAFAAADGMLFSATIVDNIRCGRVGHTQDQIDEAARQCAVLETIKSLPEGFATLVGPGGMNLPVSTAFRLGLARAMLGDPSVVIVQEPPETADEEELRAVDAALQRIRAERTLILIPSRLAALRAVERVYLIHQGQLQAEGTHTELLHAEALYRHLNYLLFTPFRDVSPCGANNTLTAG